MSYTSFSSGNFQDDLELAIIMSLQNQEQAPVHPAKKQKSTNSSVLPAKTPSNLKIKKIGEKSDGDFIVIKPTTQAWGCIEEIQKAVGKQFTKEGITTWVPTPHNLAHMTLFMGLDGLSANTRTSLMEKVAKEVASVGDFTINVKVDADDTKVKRGPFKYVILKFNDNNQLEKIHKAVITAIQSSIDDGSLDSNLVNFSKLNAPMVPHFTLGVLDIKDDKHPDCQKLNDKKAKEDFGVLFKKLKQNKFSKISFDIPVNAVHLLGVKDLKASPQNKEYVDLASCKLGTQGSVSSSSAASSAISYSVPATRGFDTISQIEDAINSNLGRNVSMTFQLCQDHKGTNMIGVKFKNQYEADEFLQTVDKRPGAKVTQEGSQWMVKLGQERCDALFGVGRGSVMYADGVKQLSASSSSSISSASSRSSLPLSSSSGSSSSSSLYYSNPISEFENHIYKTLGKKPKVTFIKSQDHQGNKMIGVKFEKEKHATKFLYSVDSRPGAKVTKEGKKWMVKLGPDRCNTLFGPVNGPSMYHAGFASSK